MSRNFNMHAIKRQARKEGRASDQWNPFKKQGRSRTWAPSPPSPPSDIEAGTIDITDLHDIVDDNIGCDRPSSPHPAISRLERADTSTVNSEIKEKHRSIHSVNRSKKWSEFKKQTQEVDLVDLSWELDETELSWDPFGCLSEELSEPGYLHPAVRVFHSEKALKSGSDQQLQERK